MQNRGMTLKKAPRGTGQSHLATAPSLVTSTTILGTSLSECWWFVPHLGLDVSFDEYNCHQSMISGGRVSQRELTTLLINNQTIRNQRENCSGVDPRSWISRRTSILNICTQVTSNQRQQMEIFGWSARRPRTTTSARRIEKRIRLLTLT